MPSSPIAFWLNDQRVEESQCKSTETLLRWLRDRRAMTGTKEGCAEGDCGACTVIVVDEAAVGRAAYRAVNACLLFLPMLQGKRVYTVEGLKAKTGELHPVQAVAVEKKASQCGYCTPGVVMSLFEAMYRTDLKDDQPIDDQLAGNLCRCTGYRPIREAAREVAGLRPNDRFTQVLADFQAEPAGVSYQRGDQRYEAPQTLSALFALRARYPEAVWVAGGTDLALEVNKKHRVFPVLIGLHAIDALRFISEESGCIQIGAGLRLTELEDALGSDLPALGKMLRVFGSRQIRNRATVGGSLCNASPIGDLAPLFLALDADVELVSASGSRWLKLSDFFLGYRQTALRTDEIMRSIRFNRPSGVFCSYKVSRRADMDISVVASGFFVACGLDGRVQAIRLAYGGLAATPKRATRTEAALLGGPWTQVALDEALVHLNEDFQPLSDHRGTADYRAALARNLLRAFFLESQSTGAQS